MVADRGRQGPTGAEPLVASAATGWEDGCGARLLARRRHCVHSTSDLLTGLLPWGPSQPQADVDKEWSKENLQLGTFPTIVYLPANSKQVRRRRGGTQGGHLGAWGPGQSRAFPSDAAAFVAFTVA